MQGGVVGGIMEVLGVAELFKVVFYLLDREDVIKTFRV